MIGAFPLLAIVIALANAGAFLGGGLDGSLLSVALPSGANLTLTTGNGLILLGLLLLYAEIFKATRTGSASILDHALSMLVFVIALIEFITVDKLGNAVFLSLLMMTLIDVVAGFTVTISAARRDFGSSGS